MVTFTVEAEDAESYQWQIDRKDGNGFVDLATNSTWQGTTTKSFRFKAIAAREAYGFRVIAKNAVGDSEPSAEVKLIISSTPAIKRQPSNQYGWVGKTVTCTVVAENATGYQWKYSSDGSGFLDWNGGTEATLNVDLDATNIHYSWKCIVKGEGETSAATDAVTVISAFASEGVSYEASGFDQTANTVTCRVTGYEGEATSLTIPETIPTDDALIPNEFREAVVTEIGPCAFENNTTLASIDLPDTIKIIAYRAFAGCTNLSSMS